MLDIKRVKRDLETIKEEWHSEERRIFLWKVIALDDRRIELFAKS